MALLFVGFVLRIKNSMGFRMAVDDATTEVGDEGVVEVIENAENIPGDWRILKIPNGIYQHFYIESIHNRKTDNRKCVIRGTVLTVYNDQSQETPWCSSIF